MLSNTAKKYLEKREKTADEQKNWMRFKSELDRGTRMRAAQMPSGRSGVRVDPLEQQPWRILKGARKELGELATRQAWACSERMRKKRENDTDKDKALGFWGLNPSRPKTGSTESRAQHSRLGTTTCGRIDYSDYLPPGVPMRPTTGVYGRHAVWDISSKAPDGYCNYGAYWLLSNKRPPTGECSHPEPPSGFSDLVADFGLQRSGDPSPIPYWDLEVVGTKLKLEPKPDYYKEEEEEFEIYQKPF